MSEPVLAYGLNTSWGSSGQQIHVATPWNGRESESSLFLRHMAAVLVKMAEHPIDR